MFQSTKPLKIKVMKKKQNFKWLSVEISIPDCTISQNVNLSESCTIDNTVEQGYHKMKPAVITYQQH